MPPLYIYTRRAAAAALFFSQRFHGHLSWDCQSAAGLCANEKRESSDGEAADEAAGEATPGLKLIPKDNRGFEGFLFFGFIYLESRVDGLQMAPPSRAASVNTTPCLRVFPPRARLIVCPRQVFFASPADCFVSIPSTAARRAQDVEPSSP